MKLDEMFMLQIWPFRLHCYEKEKANNFSKSQFSQIQKEHKITIPIKTISLIEHKISNPNITGEVSK